MGRSWETPPDALRQCVNFDVSDTGQLTRRPGRVRFYEGTIQPNSLYGRQDQLYFVESGILKVYTASGIRSLATVGRGEMHYAEMAGTLYFTNGKITGRIMADTALHWGLPIPTQQPALAFQGGGSLAAGTYQVALTWTSWLPNGAEEESGAALAETIDLDESGGIVLTRFPFVDHATTVNVYVSHPNGSVLFLYGSYSTDIEQVTITDNPVGPELETQFLVPPPPGQCLCAHNARLLIANEKIVYLTEPFYPSLVDDRENVLLYDSPVTLLYSVTDGVYVGTETDLWFLSGFDSDALAQRRIASYGMSRNMAVHLPQTAYGGMCWSERGILALGDSGQIKPLFESRIALDGTSYLNGTAGYREARPNGQRTVIFIMRPTPRYAPTVITVSRGVSNSIGLPATVILTE